uniref:LIM zinc-binding domain-containing protein n=1 Tax=Zea mays TaxID=4577 RepID=A0A804PS29_MAIZE
MEERRRRPWRPPSRGRPPSAPPATRRCTLWTSSPPTTASTTRPASAATTARAPSSSPTTTPSRECSTAGLTSTSCSRGQGAWTRASKELRRLSSQKETLGMRMLLKSQAPLLAPERNVLDAARQSIQLRGIQVTVNNTMYHKSCFKCCHGGCTISPSNYIAHEGKLYCKHHHIQLIKEKGNFSQLENDHEKTSQAGSLEEDEQEY